MDGLKLLQIFLDHESLNLDPKEKRLTGTMNMSNIEYERLPGRSPVASRVEWTHLESGGTGAGSYSMDSFRGR
jgi:hypothetical protein